MSKVNEKKIEQSLIKIEKLINRQKLTIPELLILYGNLGYHLGACMAGFQGKGPDLEILKKEYHIQPTVDLGLMLQGLLITTWEQDYQEHPVLSKLKDKLEEEKKK